jgi:hypothetical protein
MIDDNRERRRAVFIVNGDRAGLSVANELSESASVGTDIPENGEGPE